MITLNGTVVLFNEINGCGLIRPDGGGTIVRVTHKSIVSEGYKTLYEGQRVQYSIKNNGLNKPVVVNVIPECPDHSVIKGA